MRADRGVNRAYWWSLADNRRTRGPGYHLRSDTVGAAFQAPEYGRYLAEHIPGAVYTELDGDEHMLTAATAPQLLAHAMPFLQEAVTRDVPEPDKVLATILFSDIVGSTARAAELGDAQWRQVLAGHHARVRLKSSSRNGDPTGIVPSST